MKKAIIADRIYSLDQPNEYFEGLIIENEVIQELGSKESITQRKEEFDELEEVSGVVIPGFNDSHLHTISIGRALDELDLNGVGSIEEMVNRLEERITSIPKGQWIRGRGWNQELFQENRYPTRWDLDAISPYHPVFLNRTCGHIAIGNSKALELTGVNKSTKDVEGGKIDRKDGEPTGIFRELAMEIVSKQIPEPALEEKVKWYKTAEKYLNSVGITSIQTIDEHGLEVYQSLKNELNLRVTFSPNHDELDEILLNNPGIRSGMDDDKFRWGRIKIYSDGSLGAQTAAMREPYENTINTGILFYKKEKLHGLIQKFSKMGWQLEIHAIGDKGAELTIEGFEKFVEKDGRPILVHCQVLGDDLIKKMASLGVVASIQPIFVETDMGTADKFLGENRMKYSYAWKTLMENGIKCVGGSDAPIEDANPIKGIHAVVNRQRTDGTPNNGWYPNEKYEIWDGFKLFTGNSAYAEFQEKKKGLLKSGYLADFVLLNKDPFNISSEEILSIEVKATYLGGKKVFEKGW
jgi:predicted amidohydrolase YtcJ